MLVEIGASKASKATGLIDQNIRTKSGESQNFKQTITTNQDFSDPELLGSHFPELYSQNINAGKKEKARKVIQFLLHGHSEISGIYPNLTKFHKISPIS